jgi:hypothetical protein
LKQPVKNDTRTPKKEASDSFAIYAAIVVLVLFGIATLIIYLQRTPSRNDANLSYIELKQSLVNDQGMVARLAVTVQATDDDSEWLKDNQTALNELFRKELSLIDIETLRTKEGLLEFQEELKRKMNLVFKTDKVQAVMVTEILHQDQRG